MSALKEDQPLVWEETDKHGVRRLKFRKVKRPTDPKILEALKFTPLDGEAYERMMRNAPDTKERRREVTGKGTNVLPKDWNLRKPFIDPTPREWRRVAIEAAGDRFNLRAAGSRMMFLPGDRKFYGVPADLETEGLTLDQAVANGKRIEALIKLKT